MLWQVVQTFIFMHCECAHIHVYCANKIDTETDIDCEL
jgi:hypothetical protein